MEEIEELKARIAHLEMLNEDLVRGMDQARLHLENYTGDDYHAQSGRHALKLVIDQYKKDTK